MKPQYNNNIHCIYNVWTKLFIIFFSLVYSWFLIEYLHTMYNVYTCIDDTSVQRIMSLLSADNICSCIIYI